MLSYHRYNGKSILPLNERTSESPRRREGTLGAGILVLLLYWLQVEGSRIIDQFLFFLIFFCCKSCSTQHHSNEAHGNNEQGLLAELDIPNWKKSKTRTNQKQGGN